MFYAAYDSTGFVAQAATLTALLALLDEAEQVDCAIWLDGRIAAVRLSSGECILRFLPEDGPEAA